LFSRFRRQVVLVCRLVTKTDAIQIVTLRELDGFQCDAPQRRATSRSPLQLKNLFCELCVLCGQWFDFELSS
jgi:hypothetical protein